MKCIDKLIELGFNFNLKDGHVSYEYKGSNPPKLHDVKPLFEELKQNKIQAIQYLQKVIVYEIPLIDNINFDFQANACISSQDEGCIKWKRLDVYLKTKKIVITGVVSSIEALNQWQGLLAERMVM